MTDKDLFKESIRELKTKVKGYEGLLRNIDELQVPDWYLMKMIEQNDPDFFKTLDMLLALFQLELYKLKLKMLDFDEKYGGQMALAFNIHMVCAELQVISGHMHTPLERLMLVQTSSILTDRLAGMHKGMAAKLKAEDEGVAKVGPFKIGNKYMHEEGFQCQYEGRGVGIITLHGKLPPDDLGTRFPMINAAEWYPTEGDSNDSSDS